ncbi:MAG: hypothetical protein ACD_79C00858G0001, partial [uncultured bacterium]
MAENFNQAVTDIKIAKMTERLESAAPKGSDSKKIETPAVQEIQEMIKNLANELNPATQAQLSKAINEKLSSLEQSRVSTSSLSSAASAESGASKASQSSSAEQSSQSSSQSASADARQTQPKIDINEIKKQNLLRTIKNIVDGKFQDVGFKILNTSLIELSSLYNSNPETTLGEMYKDLNSIFTGTNKVNELALSSTINMAKTLLKGNVTACDTFMAEILIASYFKMETVNYENNKLKITDKKAQELLTPHYKDIFKSVLFSLSENSEYAKTYKTLLSYGTKDGKNDAQSYLAVMQGDMGDIVNRLGSSIANLNGFKSLAEMKSEGKDSSSQLDLEKYSPTIEKEEQAVIQGYINAISNTPQLMREGGITVEDANNLFKMVDSKFNGDLKIKSELLAKLGESLIKFAKLPDNIEFAKEFFSETGIQNQIVSKLDAIIEQAKDDTVLLKAAMTERNKLLQYKEFTGNIDDKARIQNELVRTNIFNNGSLKSSDVSERIKIDVSKLSETEKAALLSKIKSGDSSIIVDGENLYRRNDIYEASKELFGKIIDKSSLTDAQKKELKENKTPEALLTEIQKPQTGSVFASNPDLATALVAGALMLKSQKETDNLKSATKVQETILKKASDEFKSVSEGMNLSGTISMAQSAIDGYARFKLVRTYETDPAMQKEMQNIVGGKANAEKIIKDISNPASADYKSSFDKLQAASVMSENKISNQNLEKQTAIASYAGLTELQRIQVDEKLKNINTTFDSIIKDLFGANAGDSNKALTQLQNVLGDNNLKKIGEAGKISKADSDKIIEYSNALSSAAKISFDAGNYEVAQKLCNEANSGIRILSADLNDFAEEKMQKAQTGYKTDKNVNQVRSIAREYLSRATETYTKGDTDKVSSDLGTASTGFSIIKTKNE